MTVARAFLADGDIQTGEVGIRGPDHLRQIIDADRAIIVEQLEQLARVLALVEAAASCGLKTVPVFALEEALRRRA